jgi:hypothetical protein
MNTTNPDSMIPESRIAKQLKKSPAAAPTVTALVVRPPRHTQAGTVSMD